MSKLSKVLYLCAILLLCLLAAKPYWPAIREELQNFHAAWQAIRDAEDPKTDGSTPEVAEKNKIRERSIAQPKAADKLPAAATGKSSEVELDPFLAEARKRAQEDPEAAMQWLQEQSTGSERLRGMLEVVALWAAQDSESALLWLESNAQGLARLETLNSGVELWAQRDPRAAADWIDGMANDGSKITAAKSLAATWAKSNPEAAKEWVDGLPYGSIRDEAANALVLAWVESDPNRALSWAGQKTDISYGGQDSLYLNAIAAYTQNAPDDAEAYIRGLPVDPFADANNPPNYIREFVKARAELDPVETAEWLQGLPLEDRLRRPVSVNQLMQVWAETDSIAASAWLSEQPLGPERDAAIVGFAETIQSFEPEAAVTWANTISNGEERSRVMTQSIRTWARTQPKEALDWVINSKLEPALQEQLAREIGWD